MLGAGHLFWNRLKIIQIYARFDFTLTGMWFVAGFGGATGDCWSLARFIGGDALLGGSCGGLSGTSVLFFGFVYKSNTWTRNEKFKWCYRKPIAEIYLMADVFQNVLRHVFHEHVPPLLLLRRAALPVDHVVFGYLTCKIHHCHGNNFGLPLKAKCGF